jgi:hypothetical protein
MTPSRDDDLPKIGAPATRALHNAGYTGLSQLAKVPRAELAELHGMGPKALASSKRLSRNAASAWPESSDGHIAAGPPQRMQMPQ